MRELRPGEARGSSQSYTATVCQRRGAHRPSDSHWLPHPIFPVLLKRTLILGAACTSLCSCPPHAGIPRQAPLPEAKSYLGNSARSSVNPPEMAQSPLDITGRKTPGMKSQYLKFADCLPN